MPIIDNIELYNKVKAEVDKIYTKPSAYKSGYIVKKYNVGCEEKTQIKCMDWIFFLRVEDIELDENQKRVMTSSRMEKELVIIISEKDI
jgi:hypothetical protein